MEAPQGIEREDNKANTEKWLAVTEELRDRQDRLTGATVALIVAVREAEKGLGR